MPEIIIHLTDQEFDIVKNTISYNGRTDLEHETFSGTEINIALSPFGNTLEIKGYKNCEIEDVGIEFKK